VSMIRKLALFVVLGRWDFLTRFRSTGAGVEHHLLARDFSFARGDRAADRYVHLSGSPQVLFRNETDYERRQRGHPYLVTRVNDILVIAPGVSDPWEFAGNAAHHQHEFCTTP